MSTDPLGRSKFAGTTRPALGRCARAYAHMKEAANCDDLTPATAIRSFCLNGDLLGAIA